MLKWPDFGLARLQNKERRREPMRTIVAGQPPSAQVTDVRGAVYGTDGRATSSGRPAQVAQRQHVQVSQA